MSSYFVNFLILFIFDIEILMFGYVIIYNYLFFKYHTPPKSWLSLSLGKRLAESYVVGTFIYMSYIYFALNFLDYTRFLSNYSILLIIIMGLYRPIKYKINNNYLALKKSKKNENLLYTNRNRRIIYWISILITSFYLLAFYYWKYFTYANKTISLQALDEFFWESNVYFLLTHKFMNLSLMGGYTPGFVLYYSGAFNLLNDHSIYNLHYVLKTVVYYNFVKDIFIIIPLLQVFYGKKYVLSQVLVLLSLFAFPYFMLRQIVFLPTIILTPFILIYLYLNIETTISRTIGGILLGIFIFVHPLMGILFLIIYLVFIFYELLVVEKLLPIKIKDLRNYRSLLKSLSGIIVKFIKHEVYTIFIAFIPVLLLFFYITINSETSLTSYYSYYFSANVLWAILDTIRYIVFKIYGYIKYATIVNVIDLRMIYKGDIPIIRFIANLYDLNTFNFVISLILLFIVPLIRYTPRKFHHFIRFLRIFFGISLVIGLTPIFLVFFSESFYYSYRMRLLELLAVPLMFFNGFIIYLIQLKISSLIKRFIIKLKGTETGEKLKIVNKANIVIILIKSVKIFFIFLMYLSILFTINHAIQFRIIPYGNEGEDVNNLMFVLEEQDLNKFEKNTTLNKQLLILDNNSTPLLRYIDLYFSKDFSLLKINFQHYSLSNISILYNKSEYDKIIVIISKKSPGIYEEVLEEDHYGSLLYSSSYFLMIKVK